MNLALQIRVNLHHHQGATTAELVEYIGEPRLQIHRYLHWMKKRGKVVGSSYGWSLPANTCPTCGKHVPRRDEWGNRMVFCSRKCAGRANGFQQGHNRNREVNISFQCHLPGCEKYFTLKPWEYRQRRKNQNHFFCCLAHFHEFARRYWKKNHVKGSNKSHSVYKSRKARGVCPRCEGKPVDGKVHCYDCAEWHRNYQRQRRRQR